MDFGKVDMSKVVETPARAESALDSVLPLYQANGMTIRPTLFYYGGAALDCQGGTGFMWNGTCSDGGTVSGDAIVLSDCGAADIPVSKMCWVGDGLSPAMLHEMGHALSLQVGGDGCGDHNCPAFKSGGVVERATALLVNIGM